MQNNKNMGKHFASPEVLVRKISFEFECICSSSLLRSPTNHRPNIIKSEALSLDVLTEKVILKQNFKDDFRRTFEQ